MTQNVKAALELVQTAHKNSRARVFNEDELDLIIGALKECAPPFSGPSTSPQALTHVPSGPPTSSPRGPAKDAASVARQWMELLETIAHLIPKMSEKQNWRPPHYAVTKEKWNQQWLQFSRFHNEEKYEFMKLLKVLAANPTDTNCINFVRSAAMHMDALIDETNERCNALDIATKQPGVFLSEKKLSSCDTAIKNLTEGIANFKGNFKRQPCNGRL